MRSWPIDDQVRQQLSVLLTILPHAGTYYLVISRVYKKQCTGPYSVAITPATVVPVNLVSFTAEKINGSDNVVKVVE